MVCNFTIFKDVDIIVPVFIRNVGKQREKSSKYHYSKKQTITFIKLVIFFFN